MTSDAPPGADEPGALHALLVEAQVAAIKTLGRLAEQDVQGIREQARNDLLGLANEYEVENADTLDGRELSDAVLAAYVAAVRAWIDRLAEQIGKT